MDHTVDTLLSAERHFAKLWLRKRSVRFAIFVFSFSSNFSSNFEQKMIPFDLYFSEVHQSDYLNIKI